MRFASWSIHETGLRFRCWMIRLMRRQGWPRRSLSGMRVGLPGWRRNRLCIYTGATGMGIRRAHRLKDWMLHREGFGRSLVVTFARRRRWGWRGGDAGRDDRVQDAAGAVGEGLDPDGEEDSAAGAEERCAVAYEARGLVSPDGEHQLSVDDRAECAADAGDDHSQLAGAATDAADRLSAVHCEYDVGFYVLPDEPEGAVSEELVYVDPLYSVCDGAGRSGIDDHQHQGRAGGAVWGEERVCPNAEVQREEEGREVAGEGVSQAARHCAVDRVGDRVLLCVDGLLRRHNRELFHGAVSGAVCVWVLVYGGAEPAGGAV